MSVHTFEIKTSMVDGESEQIEQIAQKIVRNYGKLEGISSELKAMSGSIREVSASVDEIVKQLTSESDNVNNLGVSLGTIVKTYVNAEQRITQLTIRAKGVSDAEDDTQVVKTGDSSIWGEDNNYIYTTSDGNPWVFHQGNQEPVRPNFDNGYPYDPNMKATPSDYYNWVKWGILCGGAEMLSHLPDGTEAYDHYRNGDGSALEINFTKAYNQDSAIKENTDRTVAETNRAVQKMIEEGAQPPFSITSECMSCGKYPATENWQKTVGGYQVWVSADVRYDNQGNVVVNTTVHEWDRYNFNNGEHDITTGEPDDVNGRFEALGWAHSFDTYGSVSFETSFSPSGEIGVPEVTSSDGRNRVRYDTRTWR